jgi:hypothetical protein
MLGKRLSSILSLSEELFGDLYTTPMRRLSLYIIFLYTFILSYYIYIYIYYYLYIFTFLVIVRRETLFILKERERAVPTFLSLVSLLP